MNGLYLNVPPPDISDNYKIETIDISKWSTKIKQASFVHLKTNINNFHQYEDEQHLIIINGIFELNSHLNQANNLIKEIKNNGLLAPHHLIEYGFFCAIIVEKHKKYTIFLTDPLSLNSHFYSLSENTIKIAPSAQYIEGEQDKLTTEFIRAHSHAIGKYTAKKNVFRLLPFEYIDLNQKEVLTTTNWKRPNHSTSDITKDISRLQNATEKLSTCVALSSGFDSRLIAAIFKPKISYTWGPSNSRDIKVSKKLSKLLDIETSTFPLPSSINELDQDIFNFHCRDNCNQNMQVVAGYRIAYQTTKQADLCLDGFLGDVYQRGTYFYGKGLFAETTKILPYLYKLITPHGLLRSRYSKIWKNEKTRSLLLNQYSNFLKMHQLENTINSVVAFEYLWGRGVRLIGTGGAGANSTYNNVLTPLASPRIVSALLSTSPKKLSRLYIFKNLWADLAIPKEIRNIPSEHYFSVDTPRCLIYPISLIGRILVNFIPGFGNYGK